MSLILDGSKTQEALVKKFHQEWLSAIEEIQKGLQNIPETEGHDSADYVVEETDYLCFRCYHKLVMFKRAHYFGPELYYCSNDDCMAGSFYEPEAIEMTRRIYRDV